MNKLTKASIISGIALLTVTGALLMAPKEQTMTEESKESSITIKEEDTPVENIHITDSEPLQATEEVEVTTNAIEPEVAPQEPYVQSEQDKVMEIREYITSNSPAGLYGIINLAFTRYPDAFYKDKAAALNICVEVTNDRTIIAKDREIEKRLLAI